ncbi:MFS transporter [Streptomyces sp. NPDC047022]|uniref:MFS transporter n=1 Tax=Streptomyces sp. NPDC047022 TaxID=3155737 RepID=UPI0033FC5E73
MRDKRTSGWGPDFGIFWTAQTLSVLGDSFALIALPLLVLEATGSIARMGLLTAVGGAAAVLAGVFAGALVDRVDRRRLLITCDLVRMALYGLIPLVWLAGPRIWLLYTVLPLCEAVGMVFSVAYVTAVRALVGTERITAANGRLNATAAAAGVAGPVCAGFVAAVTGSAAAVAADAASFGVSALCLGFLRFAPATRSGLPAADDTGSAGSTGSTSSTGSTGSTGSTAFTGLWRDLLAGAHFLRRHPVLRAVTALLAVFSFLELGLNDMLIYHLKHDLGQSDGTVGTVLAVGTLGSIAGALPAARMRHGLGFGPTWIGAVAVCGCAMAGIGWALDVPEVAFLTALFLGSAGLAGTCSMSLRQQVTPEHLLGRVTSAFWTIHYAAAPVGAAVVTSAAQHHGTAAVGAVAGACTLGVALLALLTPVRTRHPESATEAA